MKKRGLVVAALFALSMVTAVPPATADDAVVTWPSSTRFNPDATQYTFHVEDTGPGDLYARWVFWPQLNEPIPIPHSGDVSMPTPVPIDDTYNEVAVYRCLDDGTCEGVAHSPSLEIRRKIGVYNGGLSVERPRSGTTVQGSLNYFPLDTGVPVDVSWRIARTAPGEPTVAEGTATVPTSQTTSFPVAIPAGAPEGDYRITYEIDGDFPGFGPLHGTWYHPVSLDNHVSMSFPRKSSAVIYPFKDKYQDGINLRIASDEYFKTSRATLIDAAGNTVMPLKVKDPPGAGYDYYVGFTGLTDAQEVLPQGDYRVVVEATDYTDNFGSITSPPITVDDDRMLDLTWKRTYKAAQIVSDKLVQKCSTLSKPSTHKWKGSLGFLSQTKCRDPRKSVVATMNGVYLPLPHPDGFYRRLEVVMNGGPAVGAKHAYINAGIMDDKKDIIRENKTFRGGVGKYRLPGGKYPQAYVRGLGGENKKPFILWQSGLTAGARWDVKSWTVTIEYRDLVDPTNLRERDVARGWPVRAMASWWRPGLAFAP